MWTHVYALDIETDTSELTDDERQAGYTSRGLDPRITPIVNAALSVDGRTIVLDGSEPHILTELDRILREAPPGVLMTWNGSVFDLPFIADRAWVHGIRLGLHLTADPALTPKYEPTPGHDGGYTASWQSGGFADHAHLDVAYAMKDITYRHGIPWSLKPTARAYGLNPVEVDRQSIHLLSRDEQNAYVASDAHVTAELGVRLLTGRLGDPDAPADEYPIDEHPADEYPVDAAADAR